jgi:hypothetical protein
VRARWLPFVCLCGCSLLTDLTSLSGPDASPDVTTNDASTADATKDANASDSDASVVQDATSDAACMDGGVPIVDGIGVTTTQTTTSSPSIKLGAVVPNDVVVVAFRVSDALTIGVGAINDDLGDTFTHTAPFTPGNFTYMIAFTTVAKSAPTITISLTLTGVANTILYGLSYQGLVTPAAFDVTVSSNGPSPPVTSGLATTHFPHELVFGFGESPTAGIGMTVGPTFSTIAATNHGVIEDKVVHCTGSYEVTGALTDAGAWAMMMATFPGK